VKEVALGKTLRGKKIREIIKLSNGWLLVKTDDSKSPKDFKVRVIWRLRPRIRYFTPKHAHFAIDFYGKLCANKEKAMKVFEAIIDVWKGKPIKKVLEEYERYTSELPGYSLEYILYALDWILKQEDINFKGRPKKKQEELDKMLRKFEIRTPKGREGSELAISLFCDIASGTHPVEALMKANLDIIPKIKR